ncbi:cyclic AMP-dependent transcription factor ATF-6 alpha-like isoform X2 [Mya arenaria]|nr:cyclic AMP-dependent transcription factor ATF-6 alpha-like isoform X2 [Mya arenaria]
MMGLDSHLPNVDLLTDLPTDFQLPEDLGTTHDELLNEWSDSSDSGVSGLLVSQSTDLSSIKNEPLSPSLSHTSDSCDSGISTVTEQSPYNYLFMSNPASPEPDLTLTQSPHCVDISDVEQQVTLLYDTVPSSVKSEILEQAVTTVNTEISTLTNTHLTNISHPLSPVATPHIETILNSKVKIQPRPETCGGEPPSPKKQRTTQPDVSSQKSLVLTPDEFQRLTSQGVLCFQPPKQESICNGGVLPSPLVTSVTSQCPLQKMPISSTNTVVVENADTKMFKRQQRMIKNRESASLSRKRKKEYMSSLEDQLKAFCDENERLKMENQTLKSRLSQLHTENESLKKTVTIPSSLKKTIVLSFFIFFALNLGSWSSIILPSQPNLNKGIVPGVSVHRGRQLMSVVEKTESSHTVDVDTVNKLHDFIMEYGERGVRGERRLNESDVPPMCPMYFNKTESMRLAEQLAGWMSRHEEKKMVVKKKLGKKPDKQLRPISTLSRAMRGDIGHGMDTKYNSGLDSRYHLQLYEGADTGKDFLKALHRRNDTFYVLSFDEDYYLVPAIYHNKTSRPRMSLVMPAAALNESMMPRDDEVGMMQIDCEVMNTQLVHVRKSAIPRKARSKYNATTHKYDAEYYT